MLTIYTLFFLFHTIKTSSSFPGLTQSVHYDSHRSMKTPVPVKVPPLRPPCMRIGQPISPAVQAIWRTLEPKAPVK